MKLATTTGDYIKTRYCKELQFTANEAIEAIAAAGYDAVDMNFATYSSGFGTRPLNTPEWEKWWDSVMTTVEREEIPILQSHAPIIKPSESTDIDPQEDEMIRRAIHCAERIKIPVMVFHPCVVLRNRAILYKESWEKNLRFFKQIGPVCAKKGIRIAIENDVPYYNFCSAPEDQVALIDELKDPVFGACWDFGHGNLSKLIVSDALKTLGDKLIAVHVNDNHSHNDYDDEHVLPYFGNLDWSSAMKTLREIGFCGPLTFESHSVYPGQPKELLLPLMKFAVATGRYLISLIEDGEK